MIVKGNHDISMTNQNNDITEFQQLNKAKLSRPDKKVSESMGNMNVSPNLAFLQDRITNLKFINNKLINNTYSNNFLNNAKPELSQNFVTKPKKIQQNLIRKQSLLLRNKEINQADKSSRFLQVLEVVEFDHETCYSTTGLEGRCLHEYDCDAAGGSSIGTCADGYGTCCVTVFSCYGHSSAAVAWLTNPEFPSPSSTRLSCELTLNKTSKDVEQIRLDFTNFELLPPTAGTCEQDQFVISGQNKNNVIPILCGINTGQHLYVEVGDTEGPIRFTIQTISAESRLFFIKVYNQVTQITKLAHLAAPTGCLQYFDEPQGYIKSFNYEKNSDISYAKFSTYLNNLNYAMCIKREKSACSITYTNEDEMQIVNYDTDGLPIIPPRQAGVEILNCPSDWLLISAVRLCGERLNDGSVLQDFYLNAPVTDVSAGPITVWFRSDEGYVGRGFKFHYQQNSCPITTR
ncbi:uncharacterized protein [Battus philenor]|uniref:uncharacterized protein n=1 Tax=Battus philenor TaxID=42288 RepID=UPI0035D08A07